MHVPSYCALDRAEGGGTVHLVLSTGVGAAMMWVSGEHRCGCGDDVGLS
jgi:hypothetical protein